MDDLHPEGSEERQVATPSPNCRAGSKTTTVAILRSVGRKTLRSSSQQMKSAAKV